VLDQPAWSPHDRAVRWRQLVELAARAPADGDRALLGEAASEIREQAQQVDERVRAAAALAIAPLPLPAELVAIFAGDRLHIAAPVLANARLTASEWKAVAAAASDECRAFIATMRFEAPPPAAPAPSPAPPPPPPPPRSGNERDASAAVPSISDVVARIERFRQARESSAGPERSTSPDEQPRLFRWECNESGEIEWVEGAPRGALVGQSIAQRGSATGVDRTVEQAFAARSPFENGLLNLPADSAIGGSWSLTGIPAFDRTSGRFAGYRGVAERVDRSRAAAERMTDPASLRELAHEIKTPLNAIIGFAEMITGEYLGPANQRVRDRAAEIVAQARLLLKGVEDLDFAARIRSAHGSGGARCNLGDLLERIVGAVREAAAELGVEIEASRSTAELDAAVQPEIAERLVSRMCSAVIARAARGETLRLTADAAGGQCAVSISRPAQLDGQSDEQLFGGGGEATALSLPLRLARGLAQAAGARLTAGDHKLTLLFPRA
jgi:signal transduction histidine kinase